MSGILILLAIALAVVGIIIGIHNGIIEKYNRVKQAWSDVVVQERQKVNILPKIEALLNEHKVFETELQSNITKMRTSLIELSSTTEFDTDKLKELEEATKAMKGGLKATFEAYPDLKSHNLYGSVMNEIAEQEENVGAAIRIYNSNVATFNTSIQTFPNSVINRNFTNKSEVEHFENETIESSLQFKPSFK